MSDQTHREPIPRGTARRITPRLVERVWGGTRLATLIGATEERDVTIGEVWFGDADAAPLAPLAKLLDVRERLSVQVHPDDVLAQELHGSDSIGKHEAWVILEAEPAATILLGRDPSVTPQQLAAALSAGDPIESLLARVAVVPGDVIDVPPGLLHALMPGLLVWEVQQPSDRTYRVSDWGRADASRPLHRAEAARATRAEAVAQHRAQLPIAPGRHELLNAGALQVVALVGPWSGTIEAPAGAVATLVPSHATGARAMERAAPSDAMPHGSIGACGLGLYESARLGGGETAVDLSAGATALIGALQG